MRIRAARRSSSRRGLGGKNKIEKEVQKRPANGCGYSAVALPLRIGAYRRSSSQRGLETEVKQKEFARVLDSLAGVASKQGESAGKVTIPGMIKTRMKPASAAGMRELFGKVVVVKAKQRPANGCGYPAVALPMRT